VVDLAAKSPLADVLPLSAGGVTLAETPPAFITSVMPFASKHDACSEAMQKAHDVGLPAVGRTSGKAGGRLIWTGRGQYFFVGEAAVAAAVGKTAAVTDQSDGWAVMLLEGEAADAVMARLTPIDMRPEVFKRGHTARTELAHMMTVITRTPKGFEIMVMRSFAKTAAHHIHQAMDSVAAQKALAPAS